MDQVNFFLFTVLIIVGSGVIGWSLRGVIALVAAKDEKDDASAS